MADQDSAQSNDSKEFEATEQRLRQARLEGDVPQSKEVNGFALFLGLLAAGLLFQFVFAQALFERLASFLGGLDTYADDLRRQDAARLNDQIAGAAWLAAPLLLIPGVFVVAALVVQRSVTFSGKKLSPKISKISPMDNIKNRYGPKGMLDFLKDSAKLFAAGLISVLFLWYIIDNYYAGFGIQRSGIFTFTVTQCMIIIAIYTGFQFGLAAVDLPLQRQLHANRLRMSREDMKREFKQSEGDPHFKQMRREKAAQISRGQMLKNVETATVVMVNPEHYAVALSWSPDSGKAPVCVAKGVDHLAAKIREVAIAHDVPIYSDPPSTRAIYQTVEIDSEVHPEHFAAVAAAIRFVESVRNNL